MRKHLDTSTHQHFRYNAPARLGSAVKIATVLEGTAARWTTVSKNCHSDPFMDGGFYSHFCSFQEQRRNISTIIFKHLRATFYYVRSCPILDFCRRSRYRKSGGNLRTEMEQAPFFLPTPPDRMINVYAGRIISDFRTTQTAANEHLLQFLASMCRQFAGDLQPMITGSTNACFGSSTVVEYTLLERLLLAESGRIEKVPIFFCRLPSDLESVVLNHAN